MRLDGREAFRRPPCSTTSGVVWPALPPLRCSSRALSIRAPSVAGYGSLAGGPIQKSKIQNRGKSEISEESAARTGRNRRDFGSCVSSNRLGASHGLLNEDAFRGPRIECVRDCPKRARGMRREFLGHFFAGRGDRLRGRRLAQRSRLRAGDDRLPLLAAPPRRRKEDERPKNVLHETIWVAESRQRSKELA